LREEEFETSEGKYFTIVSPTNAQLLTMTTFDSVTLEDATILKTLQA
jgi:hypothetical protein